MRGSWIAQNRTALRVVALLALLVITTACRTAITGSASSCVADGVGAAPPGHDLRVRIPERSDWVDQGEILSIGAEGAWDHYLYGGFTGTVVKKDGRFLLYYQGARDYSDRFGTVTHRAIGLAVSPDGIHFTKHPDNPVIRWSPQDGLEEGAVSAGASLDRTGRVVLFYGANTRVNDWLVDADGRVAVSPDGLRFTDIGVALDHRDGRIWGSGDELFPVMAAHHRQNVYVYYIPNGTSDTGRLGVAWGPAWDQLRSSAEVSALDEPIDVWGMAGHAQVGDKTHALFLNNVRSSCLEVRTVNLDSPHEVSAPVRRYTFDDFSQGTVYLDRDSQRWYLFHRTADARAYRVKVAPMLSTDRS